jgi:hypothetical protein
VSGLLLLSIEGNGLITSNLVEVQVVVGQWSSVM